MAALDPGTYAYVRYDEQGPPGELWHERLILSWVVASLYVVLTPDYDMFIEQLDVANADLSGLRFGAPGGGLPVGLAGGRVYRFAVAPAPAELVALLQREDEARRAPETRPAWCDRARARAVWRRAQALPSAGAHVAAPFAYQGVWLAS